MAVQRKYMSHKRGAYCICFLCQMMNIDEKVMLQKVEKATN